MSARSRANPRSVIKLAKDSKAGSKAISSKVDWCKYVNHSIFTRDDGERVLKIAGSLDPDTLDAVEASGVDSLWIGYGDWPDLKPLRRFSGSIRRFRADPFGLIDLDSVLKLEGLEVLELSSFRLPAPCVDTLAVLPRLKVVSVHWTKGLPSNFLTGLCVETLKLLDAPFYDVAPLLLLKRVQDLTLTRGRFRSLDGVAGVPGIQALDVVLSRSEGLSAADIDALVSLGVESSRKLLDNIWPSVQRSRLKQLGIETGSTKWSVNRLHGLEHLESLNIGSNLRDVDLQSVFSLPAIESLTLRGIVGARIDAATIRDIALKSHFTGRIALFGRSTQLVQARRGESLEVVDES